MTEILKALDAITSRVLAYRPKDKGVAAQTIYSARTGRSWPHMKDPAPVRYRRALFTTPEGSET